MIAPFKIFSRQAISGHCGQKQANGCADCSNGHGHRVGSYDLIRILKQNLIRLDENAVGNKLKPSTTILLSSVKEDETIRINGNIHRIARKVRET